MGLSIMTEPEVPRDTALYCFVTTEAHKIKSNILIKVGYYLVKIFSI